MAKQETTSGRVLLLALVMLLAGAGVGWVLGKPYAWRQGYDRAMRDLQPLMRQRQTPTEPLHRIPPGWRKTNMTRGA